MCRQISLHMVQLLKDMDFVAVLNIRNCSYVVSICHDPVVCSTSTGCSYVIMTISINLLVVYRESVNLIGYITRRLSADSQQL